MNDVTKHLSNVPSRNIPTPSYEEAPNTELANLEVISMSTIKGDDESI